MGCLVLKPIAGLKGEIALPGDKSISHRSLILGALANGRCHIQNLSRGEDVRSTWKCLSQMGVQIEEKGEEIVVEGTGGHFAHEPEDVLDAGNSGTTMRMLAGVLSAQPFFSVITGDSSLRRRPMSRIIEPLKKMGAHIWGREDGRFAPLAIRGGRLSPVHYRSPVASAQVKSAILLAGIFTQGEIIVEEPMPSRDHTERLLKYFGGDISWEKTVIRFQAGKPLKAGDIKIPGDPSSAAFLAVAALITPDSELVIRNVGMNPTRIGYLHILKRMGASIECTNLRLIDEEPVGDLCVRSSLLQGTDILPEEVPSAIDEIPILCIAAAFAEGRTRISGARELRVKESDRIAALAAAFNEMGVHHVEFDDGIEIYGAKQIKAFSGNSWGDHRIAMSLIVGALAAQGESRVSNTSCIDVSFPGFLTTLTPLFQQFC
jgi:3-phosphoshikimate 1-carboxyvinyltransferase